MSEKKKNRLDYETISPSNGLYGSHIKWTLYYEGMVFEGRADTVAQVYRRARRALRRYKRFEKKLGGRECT